MERFIHFEHSGGMVMTQKNVTLEYERAPVPLTERKSLMSITWIWVGFPMIITGAITGGTLVQDMGFASALWAMIIGNLMLFAYVGLLSALGAKSGMNFSMLSALTFGRKGYVVASGLLSTIVIGWFAVQTGLTGSSMIGAFHVNLTLMTLIAGVLYLLITLLGIRALAVIGMVSAPLFLILGIFAVIDALTHGAHTTVIHSPKTHSMALGVAITSVFALFADSGTMTADFTRWAKNRGHSTIATFFAFPIANLVAMLVGAILAATTTNGTGDVFGYLAAKGGWFAVLAVLFLFLNLGTVCTHCLYNGAVGWSHIVGGKMRILATILGIIGVIAAVLGIWNFFEDWLNVLGILVPPIGTILIVDQFMVRSRSVHAVRNFRAKPFVAWAIGSALALVANFALPNLSNALIGIVASGLAYLLISLPEWQANRQTGLPDIKPTSDVVN
jgi:cytosine permease